MKSTERSGRRLAIRVGAAALGAVAALTIPACGNSDDEGSATAEMSPALGESLAHSGFCVAARHCLTTL